MKRSKIDLEDIAAFRNLADAAHKAARGKRTRPDVQAFFKRFDDNINEQAHAILVGQMPKGIFKRFIIHDPKKRLIHAACFEDRIFHHAVMNQAGPVLERAMTPTTYACRPGKGVHAAAQHVQTGIRRFPWYGKIDILGYFDTIDHQIMLALLARRFKGNDFLDTLQRIIDSYATAPGKGLPIGSLTSQHFANYYLDGLDRYILEQGAVRAHVRYMDDIIWWCDTKADAQSTLALVREYAAEKRLLNIKDSVQINRSSHGVTYCGYRILPGDMRLTRRRRRQYQVRRKAWEAAYLSGVIDERKLQNAYAAVHGVTAHADSLAWRKENLRRHPSIVI